MYRLVIIENCKYNFKHNKQIKATINHAAKAKQQHLHKQNKIHTYRYV